jgi:hypothetical protein
MKTDPLSQFVALDEPPRAHEGCHAYCRYDVVSFRTKISSLMLKKEVRSGMDVGAAAERI